MHMLDIGRSSVPVQRRHKHLTRVYLFWLLEDTLAPERRFNTLSQFVHLERVWTCQPLRSRRNTGHVGLFELRTFWGHDELREATTLLEPE